jgi:hypothetical protein
MARATTGEQIVVRPSNNVFTALAAVACVVSLLGLIVVYLAANANHFDLLK